MVIPQGKILYTEYLLQDILLHLIPILPQSHHYRHPADIQSGLLCLLRDLAFLDELGYKDVKLAKKPRKRTVKKEALPTEELAAEEPLLQNETITTPVDSSAAYKNITPLIKKALFV